MKNKELKFFFKSLIISLFLASLFVEIGRVFLIAILVSCLDIIRLSFAIILGLIGKHIHNLKFVIISSTILSIILIILTSLNLKYLQQNYDSDVIVAQFFATMIISYITFKFNDMKIYIINKLKNREKK